MMIGTIEATLTKKRALEVAIAPSESVDAKKHDDQHAKKARVSENDLDCEDFIEDLRFATVQCSECQKPTQLGREECCRCQKVIGKACFEKSRDTATPWLRCDACYQVQCNECDSAGNPIVPTSNSRCLAFRGHRNCCTPCSACEEWVLPKHQVSCKGCSRIFCSTNSAVIPETPLADRCCAVSKCRRCGEFVCKDCAADVCKEPACRVCQDCFKRTNGAKCNYKEH